MLPCPAPPHCPVHSFSAPLLCPQAPCASFSRSINTLSAFNKSSTLSVVPNPPLNPTQSFHLPPGLLQTCIAFFRLTRRNLAVGTHQSFLQQRSSSVSHRTLHSCQLLQAPICSQHRSCIHPRFSFFGSHHFSIQARDPPDSIFKIGSESCCSGSTFPTCSFTWRLLHSVARTPGELLGHAMPLCNTPMSFNGVEALPRLTTMALLASHGSCKHNFVPAASRLSNLQLILIEILLWVFTKPWCSFYLGLYQMPPSQRERLWL